MHTAPGRQALGDALKSGHFDAAYYFYGDDAHLKEEAAGQLLNAAVEPETRAFNLDQHKGGDVLAGSLDALLTTAPMLGPRRAIVIRDVEGLRKDARLVLDRYLKRPLPETVLILIASTGAKLDKQLAMATTAVEFPSLNGVQLPRWIVQYVERTGGSITDDAVSLLQDAVGADLSQLALELDKLTSYAGHRPIDEDAVSAVVGIRREETLGHLLDAVAARDTVRALNALSIVLQQPKVSAVTVVMALTVQSLALAWGEASNARPAKVRAELFGLLKSAGSVYTGRSWGEAVSAWAQALPRWTAADLEHAMIALAHVDEALKESRLSSEEQLLSTLILTLCGTLLSGQETHRR